MNFIATELGVIIGLLFVIAWELGIIKSHVKGDD
jgi:hypothetical protein